MTFWNIFPSFLQQKMSSLFFICICRCCSTFSSCTLTQEVGGATDLSCDSWGRQSAPPPNNGASAPLEAKTPWLKAQRKRPEAKWWKSRKAWWEFLEHSPIAMKISFTFIEVFADVSMKSKLLSSAYDCASCERPTWGQQRSEWRSAAFRLGPDQDFRRWRS